MATFDIKMPKMGESVTECTITVLNVKVGDYIEEDTDLFEITSAKTAATIPSPVAGTIVKINYGEGDTVAVGEPVIIVDTSGQAVAPATPAPAAEKEAPAPAAAPTPSIPVTEVHRGTVERWYSPVVLERAKAAKVSQEELDKIQRYGFGGRRQQGRTSSATLSRRRVHPLLLHVQSVLQLLLPHPPLVLRSQLPLYPLVPRTA